MLQKLEGFVTWIVGHENIKDDHENMKGDHDNIMGDHEDITGDHEDIMGDHKDIKGLLTSLSIHFPIHFSTLTPKRTRILIKLRNF